MPYKIKEDKSANKKLKRPLIREQERMYALNRFRAKGLEPIDLDDPTSPIECLTCFKVTPRNFPKSRHYPNCPSDTSTAKLV